jgi:hypothetical protein
VFFEDEIPAAVLDHVVCMDGRRHDDTAARALTAVGTRAEGNDMNLGQPLVQDSGRQLVELPK